MTLLQRSPREVYRVYDEDEFLAGAGSDDCLALPVQAAEQRLHRVAGVTVLLTALGAVAALVTLAATSSTTGGRRGGAALLAASGTAGSLRTVGAHVWQQSPGTRPPRPARGEVDLPLDSRAARARRAGGAREQGTEIEASNPASSAAPAAPALPAEAAPMTASAALRPEASPKARSAQPEFGFER
jgi:hypothetical protein